MWRKGINKGVSVCKCGQYKIHGLATNWCDILLGTQMFEAKVKESWAIINIVEV